MTNPTGTQWETALLNKITNNGERIAVVEKEVKDAKQEVKEVKQEVKEVKQEVKDVKQEVKEVKQIAIELDKRLTNLDERLTNIESLLGWLKVIGSGVVAIALSLIANFIYSLIN